MLGVLGKRAKVLGTISLHFMVLEPKTVVPNTSNTFFDRKFVFEKRFQILPALLGEVDLLDTYHDL